MGKGGKWLLGLLGTTVLGVALTALLSLIVGGLITVIARANKASPVLVIVPAVAVTLFVFLVLMIVYVVKVGPWLARFRPAPPSLGPLGDLADLYASQVLKFEHRDPDGNLIQLPLLEQLASHSDPMWIADDYTRFDSEYGHDMRSIFHKLKDADLVDEADGPLFFSPRSNEERVRLAFRLRLAARDVRNR